MRENEFLKKSIDENIVDKDKMIKNIIREDIKKSRSHKFVFKIAGSFAMTAIIIVIIFFNPFSSVKGGNNIINKYSIIAYASKGNNEAGTSEKLESSFKLLENNKNTELPIGRIEIENNHIGFTKDGGGFICEGTDIEWVNFSSEIGTFIYEDTEALEEELRNNEISVVEVDIPVEKISGEINSESVEKVLYEMWKNGELNEDKYNNLKGRNLDDMLTNGNYSMSFSPKEGENFINMKIHENTNNTFKNKRNIRVKASEEVEYVPLKIFELLEEKRDISFEQLPKDNIKVEIKFKNGEIIKSNIQLSFNKDGKLIGQLKEE